MKRSIALATAALLTFAGACSDSSGVGSGRTQILLTDSPFPFDLVSEVNLYIVKVEASTSADTVPGGQTWVTVAQPDQAFDLLTLQRGSTAVLGDVDLPAGQYRSIRMTIDPSRSGIVLTNGQQAQVHWPYPALDGSVAMYAVVEDPLATGPGAKIVIDFDVGRSFVVLESSPPQFVLIPWLRAVNDAATGDLAGTVYTATGIEGTDGAPAAGAIVTVYRGNPAHRHSWWVAATGRADAQGQYRIAYLREADYIVEFTENVGMLTVVPGCIGFNDVAVARRQTTTLNAVISRMHDLCASAPGTDTSGVDTTLGPPGGPVADVHVRAWLPTGGLVAGDSIPVVAELRNAYGAVLSGRQVTWSVSDSSVARLEGLFGQYAHLRALKAGTFTITATSEGVSGDTTFTVGATTGGGTGPVSTVTLVPHAMQGRIGDTIGVNAILRNAAGQVLGARPITWAVSDLTVFSIQHTSGNYLVVRGLKVGSAQITATSEGQVGTATLLVVADTTTGGGGAVATVTITPAAISAAVGDSIGAFATLRNAAGSLLSGRPVTFTSSDSTVARITGVFGQSVLMRALKAGTATLTATSEGKSGTAAVTVH